MTGSSSTDTSTAERLCALTRILNVLSVAILAVGVAGLGLHNLGNRYFWTDESSTFYAGLGWPAPGAPPGPISAAWDFTMNGFLDPGIFHMLVRVWAINIGSEPVLLRIIPFMFFLIYVAAIFGVTRLLGAPIFVGAGVASLMLFENITPYYSIELRPYSAGLAAAVVLPLIALWLIKSPSFTRLFLFMVGVVIFGSMQYNSMPITWALAFIFALAWWNKSSTLHNSLLIYAAAFVLLWQPVLYVISRGSPFASSGGSSLDYIPDLVLTAMPADRLLEVVTSNLFSLTALPRTVFILVIPIMWWRSWLPRHLRGVEWGILSVNYLWWIVVVATLSTITLAVLGFIPWILGTRWSISEVGLIALSSAGLAAIFVRSRLWKNPNVFVLSGVATVLIVSISSARLWMYERPNDIDVMSTFAPVILSGKPGGTILDVWSYPTVRYWMEHSGEHEEVLQKWIAHGVSPTMRFDEANAEDIRLFLESDSDRLLLRSKAVLEDSEIVLPPNIQVITYEPTVNDGEVTVDLPILLVKQ